MIANILNTLNVTIKGELASRSLIYLFINGINSAIPFLVLPILTYFLSPEEYGMWGLLLAFITFLAPIMGLGFESATSRKYFDLSKKEFGSYIGTTFIINLAAFLFISTLIYIFSGWINSKINLPLWWIYAIPIFAFANMALGKIQVFATVAHLPVFYSVNVLGRRLLQTGIVLILLIIFSQGADGILISYLISFSLILILSLIWLYKIGYIKLRFSKKHAKHALNYGLPLVPYALGLAVINTSDRFFIEFILGTKDVGIFTVANQVAAAFMLVLSSTLMAWNPWVLKRMKNKQNHQDKLLIVKAAYILIVGVCVLSALLAFILPIIADFFVSDKFTGAKAVIPWLTVSVGLFGLYQILSIFLIHAEKTKTIAKFVVFALIIDLIMNYFLIHANGLIGSAQARISAYLFMFICTAFWIARNTDLPWNLKANN